jgi:murein DD-endopeptidase MepM/ murein hydrolase activator NlpD
MWRPPFALVGIWLLAASDAGFVIPSAPPVQLLQVAPDTDPGPAYQTVSEAVADPHSGRDVVVNFAFELKNSSGEQLDVRGISFSYLDAQQVSLQEQGVSPDQIAGLLLPDTAPNKDAWSADGSAAAVGKNWDAFLAEWRGFESRGFRIIDIETYEQEGSRRYAGLFTPADYAKAASVGKEWAAFLADWQGLENKGFRIIDIETYVQGGSRRYAGLFKPANYAKAASVGKQWAAFLADWQSLENKGFRIIDIETYVQGGERLYIGLFEPANYAKAAAVGKQWPAFLADWQSLENKGFRIIDLEIHGDGGNAQFTGIFKPATYPKGALVDQSWPVFLANWKELDYQGLRMSDIETREKDGQRVYSGIFELGPALHWKPGKRLLVLSPQAAFDGPQPAVVKITLTFENPTPPWSLQVPIGTYRNENAAQSFPFPSRQSDLPANRFWALGSRGGHEGPKPWLKSVEPNRTADPHRGAIWDGVAESSYAFGQQYAYDVGVMSWDGNSWEFCGGGCNDNTDYFSWEIPVRSMEDGTVLFCWRDFLDNDAPGTERNRPDGVPGGGNILWIQHTGGEVALYAHLRQNTIPLSVCPANGQQSTPVAVSRGQLLGRAGNSGASGNPHLHFHVQSTWTMNPLDKGQSVPLLLNNIAVAKAEATLGISWRAVDRRAFIANGSVDAPTSTTMIRILN